MSLKIKIGPRLGSTTHAFQNGPWPWNLDPSVTLACTSGLVAVNEIIALAQCFNIYHVTKFGLFDRLKTSFITLFMTLNSFFLFQTCNEDLRLRNQRL